MDWFHCTGQVHFPSVNLARSALSTTHDTSAYAPYAFDGIGYARRLMSAIRHDEIAAQALVSGTAAMQSKAPASKQKASTLMPMASTPVIDDSTRDARGLGIHAKSSGAGTIDARSRGS